MCFEGETNRTRKFEIVCLFLLYLQKNGTKKFEIVFSFIIIIFCVVLSELLFFY
jgi:hypothetical protein